MYFTVRADSRPLHRVGEGGAEIEAHHGRPRPQEHQGRRQTCRQKGYSKCWKWHNIIVTRMVYITTLDNLHYKYLESNTLKKLQVQRIKMHAAYDTSNTDHDIALIEVGVLESIQMIEVPLH